MAGQTQKSTPAFDSEAEVGPDLARRPLSLRGLRRDMSGLYAMNALVAVIFSATGPWR